MQTFAENTVPSARQVLYEIACFYRDNTNKIIQVGRVLPASMCDKTKLTCQYPIFATTHGDGYANTGSRWKTYIKRGQRSL